MAELLRTRPRRSASQNRTDREPVNQASGSREKYNVTKKKRSGRRKRRSGAAAVLLLLVLAAFGMAVFVKYGPGRTWADYAELYGTGAEGTVVICNGTAIESRSKELEGRWYLPAETVAKADCRWYYGEEGLLLYTLSTETVTFTPGASSYRMGNEDRDAGYQICFVEDGECWISADFMNEFSGLSMTVYEADTKRDVPQRIYLDEGTEEIETAKLRLPSAVRRRAGIKSPILTRAGIGQEVRVLSEVGRWTKVRTKDGYEGYVLTALLGSRAKSISGTAAFSRVYPSISLGEKVCLAFHQTRDTTYNEKLSEYLEGTEGINVLAPTWFSVTDNNGTIGSLCDAVYVTEAHNRGMQVWAVVDDFNTAVDQKTLLASEASRMTMISTLMTAVSQYGLDGINIDFEGIKEDSAPDFLQFLRELSAAMRAAGKILSVDNYVPAGGRSWYNLKEQGQIVDYVIIMGYDEHYKGSEPGTNASIDFTENAIAQTLYSVPEEKVIHALPFFTRLWWKNSSEESSRAVGIPESLNLVEENGAELIWQEELGQYYASWESDGTTYELWLEEAESLQLKMQKVKEYGIAGAAFWKLGLETSDVWPMISEALYQ